MMKVKNYNEVNKMKKISAGLVSGFVGLYIGDIIANFLRNDYDNLYQISSDKNAYISATINGAVIGLFQAKISTFKSCLLSVANFYSINYGLNKLDNKPTPTDEELLRNFIFDSIIVYILIRLQKAVLNLIPKYDFKPKEKSFDQLVFSNLTLGILTSFYYSYKRVTNQNQ